ncbi:3D-(3,5/4)-trihydroxycyclohexane-1,2-dione acylhydrolase (decyclizing) [Oryzibacter oryziterrae]|uniref:3D-(3,5/4)-trihydroxycyclohexane-1,2-dione acylhydrolase (decyclizing) n=1 Tax=Oryzibacter oryziterrae TaxID=2766474 RepID=UPI001F026E9C|nr:3D-(3,5/4)-trihydroxycyclohexane-1,2-dione acylhydrolase (decyclizing) [Oryzibacter oryziterrae]
MSTVRLTMAQALARFLSVQMTVIEGEKLPIFAGVWAIFGHGNVAGLGEALHGLRDKLPTYRAHNEQAMVHSAVAFAKANFRRRMMVATTSIGPGALNMVTAAAVAHVNRLPVLLLPGDVFANRRPDPVLQQVEDFGDATISASDCFKPVSRYFDRITRPEQLIPALHRAMTVLTDPADCGPVTLSLCQDVQAEAYDYPASLFEERVWSTERRIRPALDELSAAIAALKAAHKPLIVAGGGVLYSGATQELADFAKKHGIPVGETQAGRAVLHYDHPMAMGSIGVTGSSAANAMAEEADVVLCVGTRLQDFTTGSWTVFGNGKAKFIGLNIQSFDATKRWSQPLVCDALAGLQELSHGLKDWKSPASWTAKADKALADWKASVHSATRLANVDLPSDAQVIGAVQRGLGKSATVVCAAGGLPGELHKLWQGEVPGAYHLEYGFSCMGYEVAGGIGVKMAQPDRDVVVMVGDGSYMMMNSELATSVMMGVKIIVVLLDNRGYGCINRLQMATGGANFNNLLKDAYHEVMPAIDFAAHAAAQGAIARKVASLSELEAGLAEAKKADRSTVLVIDTDPLITTEAGGHWWDVAVPEVSVRGEVDAARAAYVQKKQAQRLV